MFLEYQLSAEALVRNVRNQLLSSHLGAGTAFNLGDDQLMVDRVQLLDSSELVRRQASFAVATSDGTVSVAGSKATLVLPVQVDLVEVDDLITNSATASTPFKKLPLKVLIDVTASVHQAQARLRFAFESIDFGLAGALVDEATRAQINSVVAAQIPPTSRVIDVHALQSVMGGMSMKVTNAGATTNDNGELLAVRIEINGDGKQISEWTEFFNHYQSKLPSGHDWSLLIDQQLLRKSISAQVQAGLSGSSAQFALRSGINTSWIPWASSFNVTFSGEAINACTCLWGEIDVDVDVTNSLALSVPGRDTLRLRLHLDYDLNDLEVFCCILTATLFWPIVGIIYGAKEPGALLGYVGGPALVFIGACVLTSNESLVSGSLDAISMGGEPQKLDDTTRQWDVPFTMDMGKLGGVYHLDRLLPLDRKSVV